MKERDAYDLMKPAIPVAERLSLEEAMALAAAEAKGPVLPVSDFAAWIAAARAGLDQGALSIRNPEQDLTTALAMLEVAHEALRAVCAGWDGGADMQPVLDQLDEMARGEP